MDPHDRALTHPEKANFVGDMYHAMRSAQKAETRKRSEPPIDHFPEATRRARLFLHPYISDAALAAFLRGELVNCGGHLIPLKRPAWPPPAGDEDQPHGERRMQAQVLAGPRRGVR